METSRRMTLPDGLRAVAALMVILPHSSGLFAYWPRPSLSTRLMIKLADFGEAGVQLFFVVSGFVIAYTLSGRRITVKYLGLFIIRRSIRLDPPYWAAIAFYCAYLFLQQSAGHGGVILPSSEQIVSHLFYVQGILGYGDINVVFWTLCIEVQFYFVFCLFLGMFQHLSVLTGRSPSAWDKPLFVALYILSLAWPAQLLTADQPAANLFLPHWYAFLLGAIVWWDGEGSIPRRIGFIAVLLPFAIGVLLSREDCLIVAGAASALLIAAHYRGLYRWLDYSCIQFLGRMSYSIYLVHAPIAGIVLGLQVRMSPTSEIMSFLMLVIVVVASIAVAFVLNRCVEQPSIRLARRVKTAEPLMLYPPSKLA
jgi:peptidoglycan/LPS O-acetylase OafA/YrhL